MKRLITSLECRLVRHKELISVLANGCFVLLGTVVGLIFHLVSESARSGVEASKMLYSEVPGLYMEVEECPRSIERSTDNYANVIMKSNGSPETPAFVREVNQSRDQLKEKIMTCESKLHKLSLVLAAADRKPSSQTTYEMMRRLSEYRGIIEVTETIPWRQDELPLLYFDHYLTIAVEKWSRDLNEVRENLN